MAAKTKHKARSMSKSVRAVAKKSVPVRKSPVSKKKRVKSSVTNNGAGRSKTASAIVRKTSGRMESRDSSKSHPVQPKADSVQKLHSKEYANAVHAYEAGLKHMHAEEYGKAIKAFRELIAGHADEPEICERAHV